LIVSINIITQNLKKMDTDVNWKKVKFSKAKYLACNASFGESYESHFRHN
jgi:uncharacterized membrane protein YcaP (DUF421 family)